MSVFDRVDIYTQALNTAFISAYDTVADPAPIDDAILIVPSKGRVENYPFLFPPPMFHEWQGFRAYAELAEENYRVPNKTWTAEFEVAKEDLDDEQIEGFKKQAGNMAEGAKEFRGIQVQQTLALGQTTKCYDGSNFFASSHTIGAGNNIVTGTAAGSDGVTHAMVALITKSKLVKPLLWQEREAPDFKTDMGSLEASKVRTVKFWSDMRGAAAFGFWHDAILVKFANTPTVQEMQTTLGNVSARFRSFTYPKNLASDPDQFIHGQKEFKASNVMLVCSNLIEHIVRQTLTLSLIAQTENYWQGWAKLCPSGYLNNVT